MNLLRGTEDHEMRIPICSRSKDIVEFIIKPQWFVKCDKMAESVVESVRRGHLTIIPDDLKQTWFNWLENIR